MLLCVRPVSRQSGTGHLSSLTRRSLGLLLSRVRAEALQVRVCVPLGAHRPSQKPVAVRVPQPAWRCVLGPVASLPRLRFLETLCFRRSFAPLFLVSFFALVSRRRSFQLCAVLRNVLLARFGLKPASLLILRSMEDQSILGNAEACCWSKNPSNGTRRFAISQTSVC
jgi:hypothetical protein